jgi:hypothetical protein
MSEPHSPPPVSEAVLRVRLAKLGYTDIQKLVRIDTYWEATVIKDGVTHVLRVDAQMGAISEQPK